MLTKCYRCGALLRDAARQFLESGLNKCTDRQVDRFRMMYAYKLESPSIADMVANVPDEKLETAIDQVERTVVKNESKM